MLVRTCQTAIALHEAPGDSVGGSWEQKIAYVNCFSYMAGFSAGYGNRRPVAFINNPDQIFCASIPGDATVA